MIAAVVAALLGTAEVSGPRHAASFQLLGALMGSLSVQLERYGESRRVSGAVTAGFRAAAGADYRSTALATGFELRGWLPFPARLRPSGLGGPFVGGRFDVQWAELREVEGPRYLGDTFTVSAAAVGGYRQVLLGALELTPSVSLGAKTELDSKGRLAPLPRPVLGLGLTVGAVF